MAVLKDLIVHGRSRFVNGIDADSIHANLIDANDGVFKTITTTTLDAETITTDMLNATNARVSQTLTVDGTISTNKWEAVNIANIGGNFYISPTGKADSGTITVTKTGSTTVNGVSVGVYTLVVGSASFGVTSTSSTIWGTSSKVIFTGSIAYNSSKKYPLGTCNGTMTSVSTGTNTLTGFTITGVNSPALDIFFQELGITSVSSTACTGYEMQISVYQSYYSSALHPIGILLTSYGKDKKQYIDIYGGANTLGDSVSGFANPSVRIGQLDGLPNIVDGSTDSATAPSGWGIYTDNGFFKGKIVSNAGKIANFTINGSKLYSNNHSAYNTATTGIYIGDDYISFGSGGVTYFNTSGTGKIGPWILTVNEIYNGKAGGIGATTTTAGVYLGINGLNISNGTADTTSYITKTEVNIGNKLTWKDKVLTVNGSIIANYLRIESEAEIVDVDGVISNEVVSNELEDSINGLFYYQYTVTSGGKTTVYNVSYDEERSGSPYFYIDENGNEHTVTEADLDREDGELIYHRVGGITGQLENVNQNIQITNADISAINERIDSVDDTANNNQATLGTLITDVNSINKTVSDVQADIQEVEDNISSLKSVVEILDDRIIIHSGESSIELTDKQITLMGNETGSVATITSDAINIAKTNIIEQYTGNLKWTGRTDGHLTLQRIN